MRYRIIRRDEGYTVQKHSLFSWADCCISICDTTFYFKNQKEAEDWVGKVDRAIAQEKSPEVVKYIP